MPYAATINGQWVRIASSIRLGDIVYTLASIESMGPQARAALGIKPYTPVGDPPSGRRSIGKFMTDDNGSPKEVHQLEDIPLEERKAAMLAAIDAERDRRQQLDFVYDFGETEATDDDGQSTPAGEKALQMRFEPDQRNWMALQSQALAAVVAGQGAMIMPMRAEDNFNVASSAEQVLQVSAAMVERNAAILFFGGRLKSRVRAASTSSALDAISLTVGWP